MSGIRDSGKVRSRDRVAVLAALNMSFDVTDRTDLHAQLQTAQTQVEQLQASCMSSRLPAANCKPPQTQIEQLQAQLNDVQVFYRPASCKPRRPRLNSYKPN